VVTFAPLYANALLIKEKMRGDCGR
jgi:hypothetical protein